MVPASHPTSRGRGSVVGGACLVALGLAVLLHVLLAQVVVMVGLGVAAALGGLLLLVVSLVRLPTPAAQSGVIGGALLVVVGAVLLRHLLLALGTITLVAGAAFLVAGVGRLTAAAVPVPGRSRVLVPGLVTLASGFLLLLEVLGSSRELVGVVLGVQLLVDGGVLLATSRSARQP
jgi:membrane protein HdeD